MRAIAVSAICLICVVSCSKRDESLPGGYKSFSANGNNNYILNKEDSVVVGTNVKEIRVKGCLIVGYRTPEVMIGNPPATTQPISGVYGEFILDAETGILREGLSKEEVNRVLNEASATSHRCLSNK
jgi:hypothetical protein